MPRSVRALPNLLEQGLVSLVIGVSISSSTEPTLRLMKGKVKTSHVSCMHARPGKGDLVDQRTAVLGTWERLT